MRYTAGIDLGSTYTQCVVLDADMRIVGRAMQPTGFRLGEVAGDVVPLLGDVAGGEEDAVVLHGSQKAKGKGRAPTRLASGAHRLPWSS